MTPAPRLPLTALASLALLLAGCGSTPQASSTPPVSATPTPATSATASPSPTAQPPQPGPVGGAVPAGFSPVSVTFVSLQEGFVLGSDPCSSGPTCLALVRTMDGGHTWASIPAPATSLATDVSPGSHGVRGIRFADASDGWAFGPELWATHDGGATWARQSPPGASGTATVVALAASGGAVQAAMLDGQVVILSSPAGSDAWSRASTSIPIGAGPVPRAQVVVHGSAGWVIEVDRTVIGGARMSGGQWASWSPPCRNAGGDAMVDATSPTDVFAVCNQGVWTSGPPITRSYTSSDGGSTFAQGAAALPIGNADEVASAMPGTAVVAGHTNGGGQNQLLLTTDGGGAWTTVWKGSGTSVANDLGFTSAQQGVVVEVDQSSAQMLMTTDGGRTWAPVAFS